MNKFILTEIDGLWYAEKPNLEVWAWGDDPHMALCMLDNNFWNGLWTQFYQYTE